MSDSDTILKVENLSKTYFSKHQPQRSIKDLLTSPFQQQDGVADKVEALKDVSFELKRGESLGIIGPNGAGKSTLLKILSGVTSPTSGKITINGRVLSVLDIGTGFHPDLTGRENVYLNGEILGMSQSEIDTKYPKIVDFSGIGPFINRPVKQYSSGMFLRLAFSIVVSLDADLLLFDEVLAVGDLKFKLMVRKKIESLMSESKSMILATHDLTELARNTKKTIRLDNGRVVAVGKTLELAKKYEVDNFKQSEEASTKSNQDPITPDGVWESSENVTIHHRDMDVLFVEVCNGDNPRSPIFMNSSMKIRIKYNKKVTGLVPLVFQINDISQSPVFGSLDMTESQPSVGVGIHVSEITVPSNFFNEGIYLLDIGILDRLDAFEIVVLKTSVLKFQIRFNENEKDKPWYQMFPGSTRPVLNWETQKTIS